MNNNDKKYLIVLSIFIVILVIFCFGSESNKKSINNNLKKANNKNIKLHDNSILNSNLINNDISIPGRITLDSSEKIIKCPSTTIVKTYNRKIQESGIECPIGSTAGGTTSAKEVGKYIQICIPINGYKFPSDCSLTWIINHSSSYGTIKFHANNPLNDQIVNKEYNKSVNNDTLLIPNNWSRSGYVFTGWSKNKNAKSPDYNFSDQINPAEILLTDTISNSDLYAVWSPLNKTYGNVIFIGDSYVKSSNWPQKTAEKLGLNGSYTLMDLSGLGFINSIRIMDNLGNETKINFFNLLSDADDIIADNDAVKYVIIMAGYNDYYYDMETLKQSIISFSLEMHKRFPKAILYLGMVGTNFKDSVIEEKLLTITDVAYREAANSLNYVKYVPYNGNSISEYLKQFGNIYDDTYSKGCLKDDENNLCYYLIESTDTITYALHPSKKTGNIIANITANFIKNNISN